MTPSRKPHPVLRPLAAIALAVAAFAAPLASAQAAVDQNGPQTRPQAERPDDRQGGRDRSRSGDDRYGSWQQSWGTRPPAPPRSFTRTADWHRHVRACQMRFRSYDPATDRYTVRRGQTAICRL